MKIIEQLILEWVTNSFKEIKEEEQISPELLETIDENDGDLFEYLVSQGFPENCAKLSMDTYFRLPYRLRTLVGLSEMGIGIGDDYVPCRPNSFRYGGYESNLD
jgi:hypothetical protein